VWAAVAELFNILQLILLLAAGLIAGWWIATVVANGISAKAGPAPAILLPKKQSAANTKALAALEASLDANPRDPAVLEYATMLLIEMRLLDAALARVETLIAVRMADDDSSHLARAYRLQAWVYESQAPANDLAAYVVVLKAVAQLAPRHLDDCPLLYEHLAAIAQKLGEPAAAAEHLREARACYERLSVSAERDANLQRVTMKLNIVESNAADAVRLSPSEIAEALARELALVPLMPDFHKPSV
jgi:tetratricopeptide (TPR) repeat protein